MKAFLYVLGAASLWVGLSGSVCLADMNVWMDPGDVLFGTLTWDSQIFAGGEWAAEGTSFSYTVNRPADPTAPLHYSYTFTVPTGAKSVSHYILQVSPGVEGGLPAFDPLNPDDYLNGPPVGDDLARLYGVEEGNPGWPVGQSIWGIKFEDDMPLWTIEFDSFRLPTEGSFYAKAGGQKDPSFAYNTGLDGGDDFILVPDTAYVPLPATVVLAMLGLGVSGLKLRKYV